MHELGLIIDVVEMVEQYADEHELEKIQAVVLSVGEGFSVVPRLMQRVYRQAITDTLLEGSELELEIVEASGSCRDCGASFNPLRDRGQCPACGSDSYTVMTGKEFEIKEIVAADKKGLYPEST